MLHRETSSEEIEILMQKARESFIHFSKSSLVKRCELLHEIANQLNSHSNELILSANQETNLSAARLKKELDRTIFQLKSYGDHCKSGQWLDARIDIPADGHTVKKDIRKTMTALGPVVVFGASNFPFAYSTAGGDTACAMAAGCPVIVKAHPGHPATSEKVSTLIQQALKNMKLPEGIFSHVYGTSFSVGETLVKHPNTKAVAFTGSFSGGKQLFDWGNQRKYPIPIFSEMGSLNPVFIFPQKISQQAKLFAVQLADSITYSSGQFCTKPGLIFGIKGEGLDEFIIELSAIINSTRPEAMLNESIYQKFLHKKDDIVLNPAVKILAVGEKEPAYTEGSPTIAISDANHFLSAPEMMDEVFGPFCIIITCSNEKEMLDCALKMEGQLTASIIATDKEIKSNPEIIHQITQIAGRIIINGVPTGIDVCLSMHHGGPFPATTDSRFTSVGGDGIKRFARPVSFQHFPEYLLPEELKNDNPLNIWRTVNNNLTREKIH